MTREGRAIRGGGLVAANHLIAICVSVLTALLLSRVMGPKIFAVFAFCGSLSGVTGIISRLGINGYLITRPENPSDKEYHVALTAMLAASFMTGVVTILLLPGIERFGHISNLFWPGVATIALLPIHVLSLPANTRLERDLRFKPLISIEFIAQLLGPCVGIVLALGGLGIWGMITGWSIRTLFTAVAPWVVIRMKPQFAWNSSDAWHMFKFGFKYLLASTVDQGRNLVILLIVGRLLSQEAVGHIELTLRAVRLISPIRAAVSRVVLPTLAPIAAIPSVLRKTVDAIVETELVLSVPMTVVAVWAYPFCVRNLLGAAWQPTIQIFPWMAGAALLTSVHATVLSVLHIKGYFRESILSNAFSLLGLAVLMLIFGRIAGLPGCAAAGVVVWPTFWIREWVAGRQLGTQWSRNGVAWALGGTAACFAELNGILFFIPLLFVSLCTYRSILLRLRTIATSRGSLVA